MKKWNPMTKKISYRQLNVCNSRLWKIHFLKDDENEDHVPLISSNYEEFG